MDLVSFEGPERVELAPGYTVSRVINGCWQLSEGHSLTSPIDFDDVTRAYGAWLHHLRLRRYLYRCRGVFGHFRREAQGRARSCFCR